MPVAESSSNFWWYRNLKIGNVSESDESEEEVATHQFQYRLQAQILILKKSIQDVHMKMPCYMLVNKPVIIMNLRSISILNNDTERNALAHPNIIAKYANVSLILFIRCMTLIVAEILHPTNASPTPPVEQRAFFLGVYNVYKDEEEQVKIIGNGDLNEQLEKLSTWLHPYITTANKSPGTAIVESFNRFKDYLFASLNHCTLFFY
ncbi:hypothetical protein EDC94DRAFT_585597 [Helicostylum pulchrum]|nr:hypothetical protein EDC94DRAFT_585597 [Helicostylum pulchrum]